MTSRPSHIGGPGGARQAPSQPITLRLVEKSQEWEAIAALDETTQEIMKDLRDLAAQGNIMADGGRGEVKL